MALPPWGLNPQPTYYYNYDHTGLEIRILIWVQKVATSDMGIGANGGKLPHNLSHKEFVMNLKTLKGLYVLKASNK